MKQIVFVTTSFEGVHNWPNAPKEVGFLRHPHRHMFHVKLCVVTQEDREVEFIMLLEELCSFLSSDGWWKGSISCGGIGNAIYKRFHQRYTIHSITVSEDNENGVILTYEE